MVWNMKYDKRPPAMILVCGVASQVISYISEFLISAKNTDFVWILMHLLYSLLWLNTASIRQRQQGKWWRESDGNRNVMVFVSVSALSQLVASLGIVLGPYVAS